MSKILAIDLDGTLFYPNGHKRMVSKKNVAFLRRFIDSGNKVVLVTSRADVFVEKVIKEIDRPVDYLACTGAIIKVDGKVMSETSISNDVCKSVLDDIMSKFSPIGILLTTRNYEMMVHACLKFGRIMTWTYKIWYRLSFGIYRQPIELSNQLFEDEINSGKIYGVKVFFGLKSKKTTKELNKEIRELFMNQIEASWVGPAIELTPVGCDKANAIKHYANLINANHDDIYVIGDSGNDISMFNEFRENSFVMAHGYPSVKKYAKHEISRVYKIEKYVLGKESNNE